MTSFASAPFADLLSATLGPVVAATQSDHSWWSILLAILGIGFLIFVHELGHFLACRMTGTRVETFSIGFGPRLFGWERGPQGGRRFTVGPRQLDPSTRAMDVRIAAIPLGGYVKMAGEIGGDGTARSGYEGDAPRPASADEFPAKPFLSRVFIICAGVLMNLVTAFVFFWIAYGRGLPDTPPVIGDVTAGGPAWKAGLRAGDRVLSIDGQRVRSFTDVQGEIVYGGADHDAELTIRRGDATQVVRLRPEYDEALGFRRAQLEAAYAWKADDGKHPAFTVGPFEPVLVAGRPVTGGAGAFRIVADAVDLGLPSIPVEFPTRPGSPTHVLDLTGTRTWSTSGPFRLGIALAHRATVSAVRPGGPAAAAGLRPGDEVTSVDEVKIEQAAQLGFLPRLRKLTVLRRGPGERAEELVLEADAADRAAVAAFLADVAFGPPPSEGGVVVVPHGAEFEDGKSPAQEAGLRPGDRLLRVGEKEIGRWSDMLAVGATLTAAPVKVRVRSGDEAPRDLTVVPRPVRDPRARERLFTLEAPTEVVPTEGPFDAAAIAAARTWKEVGNIFRMIGGFFGQRISFQKNVGGPFTIATISSRTVSLGWTKFLAFLAFISVNLAVLNILPIPVLDGGHLLFLLVEKLRGGRPLREATIAKLQLVGFVLLMVLMVFALSNDAQLLFGD